MLASEPTPVSALCKKKWGELGALTIDTFKEKGDKTLVCFEVSQLYFRNFPAKKPHMGQACLTNEWKQGICRCISAIGGVFEGQFRQGKKEGFAREIFADGGYMIGTFKRDKLVGKCTHYDFDGNVVSEQVHEDEVSD